MPYLLHSSSLSGLLHFLSEILDLVLTKAGFSDGQSVLNICPSDLLSILVSSQRWIIVNTIQVYMWFKHVVKSTRRGGVPIYCEAPTYTRELQYGVVRFDK